MDRDRAHMLYVERRLKVLRGEHADLGTTQTAEEMQGIVLKSLARTAALTLGYVLISILLVHPVEGWSAADCAYFAIVTLTTDESLNTSFGA